jgi:metal-sulfur cluster biosynthetic enzyme
VVPLKCIAYTSLLGDAEINSALPTEEAVREALRSVEEPEVGTSIVELGLVYRIDVAPERVHIAVTMTTPACPTGELITDPSPP